MGSSRRRLAPGALALILAGCASVQPLPDQASSDAPADSSKILVLTQFPQAGKRFVVERDGEQEIWLVKDNNGTIEFIDPSSGRVKLGMKLGPCFSFAVMHRPGWRSTHDFEAMGKPAHHTVPPDCRVWDGRTWTETYAVQMPALPQPCYYGARRRVKVEGQSPSRLVTSESLVEVTGPGVRGGIAWDQYRIVYSEELQFFKELSPGYFGRKAIIIRELK